jgi:lipopolysaccharide export LptBFGC system permease protein LptF
MKYIKTYETFDPQTVKFEFLATMGTVEKAIIHIINVHEKHYYNNDKLTKSPMVIDQIKNWIQSGIVSGELQTNDILNIIRSGEREIYNDNRFKLLEDDESMFGIIDDLLSLVNVAIKQMDNISVNDVEEESEHIISSMDDSWIYQSEMDEWYIVDIDETIKGLNDILTHKDSTSPWLNEEEFILDIEKAVGKTWETFNYADKLSAFNYIQKLPFLEELSAKQRTDLLDQFHSFLGI